MIEPGFWSRFALAALVAWRVTHLLAREDGPGDILARLRARLGSGFLGQLMDCFYCASLWVAAPLALFAGSTLLDCALAWPALSAAACLLERVHSTPPGPQVPLVIETQKGDDHGMLRSETRSDAATDGHAGDAGDRAAAGS
jgi:hypothetical protein